MTFALTKGLGSNISFQYLYSCQVINSVDKSKFSTVLTCFLLLLLFSNQCTFFGDLVFAIFKLGYFLKLALKMTINLSVQKCLSV